MLQVLAKTVETQKCRGEQDALRSELIAVKNDLSTTRGRRDEYLRDAEQLRAALQAEVERRRSSEAQVSQHEGCAVEGRMGTCCWESG